MEPNSRASVIRFEHLISAPQHIERGNAMDKVVNDTSRANDSLDRVANALGTGVVLLDSQRRIAWMDRHTRSRLNGGAEQFAANLRAADTPIALVCSVYAADL